MKITAQEEYGLRILISVARDAKKDGISIPQLSQAQGLSEHYVGKLSRILRLSGFIKSTRGRVGGYLLNKPANRILLKDVLKVLGGSLYDSEYCEQHIGTRKICPNFTECPVRPVWEDVQHAVDGVLNKVTLADIVKPEKSN